MRYIALALDYDGTLATHGQVPAAVVAALKKVKDSGRKIILVTGRHLENLLERFPQADMFDHIVAENGGLLYRPSTKEKRVIGEPPPEVLIAELRKRKVEPLDVGRCVIATRTPHETVCMESIRDLGLEHHIIFNKGAVMILPSGVNKATGLKQALSELGVSLHNTVGMGDAENDHQFLSACECGVAVANSLDMLKERADFVTKKERGEGVIELIDQLLKDDLSGYSAHLERHHIDIGRGRVPAAGADGAKEAEAKILLDPFGTGILVAGPSGSGKSTATIGILELLTHAGYQICLIDPEGDYENFEETVNFGNSHHPPDVEELLQYLGKSENSAVVNMLAVPLPDRPAFFASLLPRLQELRATTGRPHWIVIDEAHHMLHAKWEHSAQTVPQKLSNVMMITVIPSEVSPAALSIINMVVAVGKKPDDTISDFAKAAGIKKPDKSVGELEKGEVAIWQTNPDQAPLPVRVHQAKTERRRHLRKYAVGDLQDRSFYFKGPVGKLNLRAQNLSIFVQMADGVDDETWLYHLNNEDVANWFEYQIRDKELAAVARQFGKANGKGSAAESRDAIKTAIETRYTAPASQSI